MLSEKYWEPAFGGPHGGVELSGDEMTLIENAAALWDARDEIGLEKSGVPKCVVDRMEFKRIVTLVIGMRRSMK